MKRIILLNPPTLFKLLVSAIGAVADARTLAKLVVAEAPSAAALCSKLQREHAVGNADALAFLEAALSVADPAPGALPPLPPHAAHLQV